MARSGGGQFVSQAALQTMLRYDPQAAALMALQRQAEGNYGTSVAQARAGALGARDAIDRATPGLAGVYDHALSGAEHARSLVAGDIASLGPGVNRFAAAGSAEQGQAVQNLEAGRAQALGSLADRRLATYAGEQGAEHAAHDKLVAGLQQIFQSRADLAGQAGAFKQLTALQLQQQAEKLAGADRQKSADRATRLAIAGVDSSGQPIPGGKVDLANQRAAQKKAAAQAKIHAGELPGGVRLATPQQHGSLRDAIDKAQQTVAQLQAGGRSRGQIIALLTTGRPAMTVKANGQNVKIPAIPAAPAAAANAAVDLTFDGGVTPGTARVLHRRGISIKRLGYKLLSPGELTALRDSRAVRKIASF